jgi:type IV pilus assembly protein PilC
MSFFRYEAVDQTGKIVMGTMDAPSEMAVSARLAQMGYRANKVVPSMPVAANGKGGAVANRTAVTASQPSVPLQETSKLGGAKPKDMALFFRQFAALIRSGINLFQALDNLYPRTEQPGLKQTAREMADAARTGGRISDVMEKYPRIFAPHVVASVRGGEKGGFLEIVLDEIALEYEQEVAFYKGTWLPKSLVIQELIAVALAQPLFPTVFPDGKTLLYVELVLFRNIPIAIALVLLVRWWWSWMKQPERMMKRDTLVLKIPVFGELARQRSLASFIRMLRQLFRAGVGPINAWEGAMNVAPNAVIRAKLAESYGLMAQNIPLHDAFIATGLFANETEQLLATGVISGQMVDMLDRVAEYYQGNVDRAFSSAKFWMWRLSITVFIALIGVVVCWMAYSYFHGIFHWVDANFGDNG